MSTDLGDVRDTLRACSEKFRLETRFIGAMVEFRRGAEAHHGASVRLETTTVIAQIVAWPNGYVDLEIATVTDDEPHIRTEEVTSLAALRGLVDTFADEVVRLGG